MKIINKYIALVVFGALALTSCDDSILDVSHCPHARNQNCNCKKPNPGLINQALNKYPSIDLDESFYVGDSLCDMQLAKNFNLTFYGINIPCENKIKSLEEIIKSNQ